MPHFIGRIETTRIGRYAGGERYQLTRKHPIIQFLTNPNFEFSPDLPHDNPQFMSNNGLWCAKIPEGSTPSPPRIKQLGERGILVLDVGCSTGANLLLLEDFLQEVADKDVKVKGYENCESRLTEARAGLAEYHTTESLLHPRVREAVKRYFIETKKFDPVFEYDETTFYYALRKEFTGRLAALLNFGDARNIPEKDNSADITICTYVLRYYQRVEQWKIFKELLRVTKPDGYIFTEGFVFRKGDRGVEAQNCNVATAISFYDPRVALPYPCGASEYEFIAPVTCIEELDDKIKQLESKGATKKRPKVSRYTSQTA